MMKILGLSFLLATLVASPTFAAVESGGNHLRNLRKGNNKNTKIAVKRAQGKFWNWLYQNNWAPTGDACFQDQSLGAPGVFFGAGFWNPTCDETLIPTRTCEVDVKDDFMVPVGMNAFCAPGECMLGDVPHPDNPHGDCDTYDAAKRDCKLYDKDGLYDVGTATLNGEELTLYKATTDSFYVTDDGVTGSDYLPTDKGFAIGYYAYIKAGTMPVGSSNDLEIVAEESDWDFDGECDDLWSVKYVLNIVDE